MPVLEKTDLILIVNKNLFGKIGYKIRRTSGTSGIPTVTCWRNDEYYRSIITLWRRRQKFYGVTPQSKMVKFSYRMNDKKGIEFQYENSGRHLVFDRNIALSNKKLRMFYDMLMEFQPEWLYVQPGILRNIILYFESNNLKFPCSLKYIETTGEMLDQSLRNMVREFTPIMLANMYGSEEFNGIAFECPYGNMHIITDNVFVECQDKNGHIKSKGNGDIIVTGLHNTITPLIRYKLGDTVQIQSHVKCKCGSKENVLSCIEGRTRHTIKTNRGEISEYMLVEGIEKFCTEISDLIIKYKFNYSRKREELVLSILINPKYRSVEGKVKTFFERYYYEQFNGEFLIKIIIEESLNLYETQKKALLFNIVD